jgi:fructose-1,6-bisphosphatase/inositol monophosphatase family enzyme
MSDAPSAFLEHLGEILKEASAKELMPRFRKLASGDVIAKPSKEDPTDLVTVADRAAEAYLAERLRDLLPGSLVVGEEAVAADQRLLLQLDGSAPVWLIDPLDGTRYFAAGEPPFGPMVALVERGEILAAAIHLPLANELFLAERNLGTYFNGARVLTSDDDAPALRGALFSKFMPEALSRQLTARQAAHRREDAPPCAAHVYPRLSRGISDYAVYYRLLPWDHAPGALILREAGGVSRHPTGQDFGVSARREPLLVARSESVWQRVSSDLFG